MSAKNLRGEMVNLPEQGNKTESASEGVKVVKKLV
jgi:hypothetical protein